MTVNCVSIFNNNNNNNEPGARRTTNIMRLPRLSTTALLLLAASSSSSFVQAFAFCCCSSSLFQNQKAARSAAASNDEGFFFDPFLHSPHSYPNGIENGPKTDSSAVVADGVGAMIVDEIFESSASFGFMSIISEPPSSVNKNGGSSELFDPLLSPHAYPDGIDAGPVVATPQQQQRRQLQQSKKKLGILLIDHGSKREASNQHLHFIAEMYESSIVQRDDGAGYISNEGGAVSTYGRQMVVRAAHMEIAQPSILEALVSVFFMSIFYH